MRSFFYFNLIRNTEEKELKSKRKEVEERELFFLCYKKYNRTFIRESLFDLQSFYNFLDY